MRCRFPRRIPPTRGPKRLKNLWTRPVCDSLAIAIGTSHGAFKYKPGHEAAAPLRHSGRGLQASAGLPHRAPRRILRHAAGVCPRPSMTNGGKLDGGHRHSGGYAAQGCNHGGLQDQHRFRPAPCHDRAPSASTLTSTPRASTPAPISSPPAPPSTTWSATRS